MAQVVHISDGQSPAIPPGEEVSRQRMDYLSRLGINRGNAVPWPGLSRAVEAADRLQHDETDNEELHDVMDHLQDLKSQGDVRFNFLRKLSYSKVWVPPAQSPPRHQTVIIFDWDDTLLCTSFLNSRRDRPLHPSVEQHLCDIQRAVKRLLELARGLGHTFIITNALPGWVEYSAAMWAPDLLPELARATVISARANHEREFPDEVHRWKVEAFLEVRRQLDPQIVTNLIALGDSDFEMDAVHAMSREFAQAVVKTIRFRLRPLPGELARQLELVSEKFARVVERGCELAITLEASAA